MGWNFKQNIWAFLYWWQFHSWKI